MTVYITKWALTRGILVGEVGEVSDTMVRVKTARGYVLHFFRDEWHTDLSAAKTRTMDMILAKEKALSKQIAKLTKLAAIVPLILEENIKKL